MQSFATGQTILSITYCRYLQSISMGMLIEDVRGQTLPAVEVFSLSIQALKDHMSQTLLVKNITLDDDTNWILTVPAIWSDTAKLFMRKGAEMVRMLFILWIYFFIITVICISIFLSGVCLSNKEYMVNIT